MTTLQIQDKVSKIRDEISKAGIGLLYYLRLNFFANYSAIV